MDSDVMKAAREAIEKSGGADELRRAAEEAMRAGDTVLRCRAAVVLAGIEAATAAESAPSDAAIEAAWQRVLRWISEIPYRFSPNDIPGAMVVTEDELRGIVDDELVRPLRRARQPQPADELFLSSQVAKMREERDRAVEALRGLVEACESLKSYETDGAPNHTEWDRLYDRLYSVAMEAKEVLRG